MRALIVFLIIHVFFIHAWSQESNKGVPLIGNNAPAFVAESTEGTIHFPDDFGRYWKIIFAHPRDFTPVCSSEILELAHAEKQFNDLGAKLLVMSADQLETHFRWKEALEQIDFKERGQVKINFPLIEDKDYHISSLYGMIHPHAKRGENIRGVFFVDRENKIRAVFFYPSEIGRSTDEIIRTLIALQKTDDDFNVKTPANWKPGEPVMVAYPNDLMVENMSLPNTIYFQYAWFMVYWKNR